MRWYIKSGIACYSTAPHKLCHDNYHASHDHSWLVWELPSLVASIFIADLKELSLCICFSFFAPNLAISWYSYFCGYDGVGSSQSWLLSWIGMLAFSSRLFLVAWVQVSFLRSWFRYAVDHTLVGLIPSIRASVIWLLWRPMLEQYIWLLIDNRATVDCFFEHQLFDPLRRNAYLALTE